MKSEESRKTLYSVTEMRITVSHCYMPNNTHCPPAMQLRQTRQCVMLEKCDGVQHEFKSIYEAAATTAILVTVVTVAKRSFKYTEGLYFSESMFHFYRQEK